LHISLEKHPSKLGRLQFQSALRRNQQRKYNILFAKGYCHWQQFHDLLPQKYNNVSKNNIEETLFPFSV
jgi:hypothetical protein